MVRIVGLLMVITPYDDMILGEKIRFEPNRTEPTIRLPFSSISLSLMTADRPCTKHSEPFIHPEWAGMISPH